MVKVALTGGAYQAHSVIASAQRCVNLFPEPMPAGNQYTGTTGQGEPSTHAHYPTPGIRLLGVIGAGPIRGIRQCTTGGAYVVSGSEVYSIDTSAWTGTLLGSITPGLHTPVSMQDNGLDMLIVDGSANGWDVTLAANTMAPISDPSGMFSGSDRVDYLDTYFLFNKPGTPQFYISGSLAVTFDPLDFANKEAYSDLLVVAVVAKRLVYLFGERTTEIWYDAGATDIGAGSFPFAAMQSEVFIDHGCVAKYSPAVYDNSVFWLTRDRQGQGIVMMVSGYQTKRVSTYAIEAEIAGYDRISDAIGFTYQLAGHSFYVLTFPAADHTWSYDITTGLWHEWVWIDTNGAEHRHRANCFWPVNDTLVVGDWQNGNLYALDHRVFTDNGQPIKRVRAFPHMLADGKRVFYRQFLADMETGTAPEMLAGTETRLDATFTAADGTPLASYTSEVGGGWTAVGGAANAQIASDMVVGTGGVAVYQSAATILTPDYSLHFDVVPPVAGSVVTGTTVWAAGRTSGANTGYQAAVSADGTQYRLTLSVLPSGASASVVIGTIASGRFTVWLLLRGSNITAQVQRSVDNMWLRTDATWHADPGTIAAQFNDATYTLPGSIMIGGTWPVPPPPPTGLTAAYETGFPSGYTYLDSPFGGSNQTFDFTNNLYYAAVSSGANNGITVTDLTTMHVVRTVTLAAMYAGTSFGSPPGSAPADQEIWDLVCGNNTDLYMLTSGTGLFVYEYTRFTRVDRTTMKVTGDFYIAPGVPPPIRNIFGQFGAVNRTAGHTIVAYNTHSATLGPTIMDGTGMAPIGLAAMSGASAPTAPGAIHTDGSCDFISIAYDNSTTVGDVYIYRINVTDSLALTTTNTGILNVLSLIGAVTGWRIGQVNYDTTHDALIMWLSSTGTSPVWIVSVNWNGSIRWSVGPYSDLNLLTDNRGQSQLTGTTLMVGPSGDLRLIDTGTGSVTLPGAVAISDYFYRVWDAGRSAYWTYALGGAGFTKITLPVPALTALAMDNVIATAQQTLLSTNLISLRWSDDRGHSFGSPVSQSIGEAGEYRTSLQWQRLAYARDRVFEISWSVPMRTALQGCFVDVTPAQS